MVSQITVRISPCLAKQGSYLRVHVEMMSHFFIVLFTVVEKLLRLFPYSSILSPS